MRNLLGIVFVFFIVAGLLLIPIISSAVPSNDNGNAGGNGNHYGWDKNNDKDQNGPSSVPEPSTLTLLGLAIVAMSGYLVIKRIQK
jgi:hypothetical protein